MVIIGSHTIGVKLNDQFLDMIYGIAKALSLPLIIMTTRHYRGRLESKFENIIDLEIKISVLKKEIIDSVLEENNLNDLIIIPSMSMKKRFSTRAHNVTYNLLKHSKSSLMVLHCPH